jgi:hypothetical protein
MHCLHLLPSCSQVKTIPPAAACGYCNELPRSPLTPPLPPAPTPALPRSPEPLCGAGRGGAPPDRVRQGRPDPRLPGHPRHRALHPGGCWAGGTGRYMGGQTRYV